MSIYEIAALERKMFRFLTYIPENSPLWHFYDSVTGNHRFVNSEGYFEKLVLSREEWHYLLAQHHLLD